MDNKFVESLKELILSVKKLIDNKLTNNEIKSDEEVYFRWKLDKFKYTEKGVTESSAHGEYLTKKTWFSAMITIDKLIKNLKEYNPALSKLNDVFGKNEAHGHYLDSLIRKITSHYLEKQSLDENTINNFVNIFIKDLNDEPLKCWAEVEINGITLTSDNIQISPEILIRKVTKEDLEKESPVYSPPLTHKYGIPHPSAIIQIELMENRPQKIQEMVEKVICILRLFKVGSTNWSSYKMDSESMIKMFGGTLTSNKNIHSLETYNIKTGDEKILKDFFKIMNENISKSFFGFGQTKIDYTTIAYNRYCDALLQNGIVERRIANVIMGLEALFLKPGETQELSYRLSLRITKFMKLIENDNKVMDILKDAYKVRSIFAHGGHLSYKEKKKLNSKYEDVRNFLQTLLNYLRISIVLLALLEKEKEEFIDVLDCSFIYHEKEKVLTNQISNWKKFLLLEQIKNE